MRSLYKIHDNQEEAIVVILAQRVSDNAFGRTLQILINYTCIVEIKDRFTKLFN